MGCRMSSSEVAREIVRVEQEMELPPIDVRVADPQMWASQDGPSPQQNMRTATSGKLTLRQGRRDRKANYTEVIDRLNGKPDDDGVVRPMFYVTDNCRHFWRTVPGLVLDTLEPDKGPATRMQEDHIYDEVAFGLATFAGVMTREDRYNQEMAEMAQEMGAVIRDPYAVRSRRGR